MPHLIVALPEGQAHRIGPGREEQRPIGVALPRPPPAPHEDLARGKPGAQPLTQVAGRSGGPWRQRRDADELDALLLDQ